jgi:hypothetical protein
MYLLLHPRAAPNDRIRVWVGAFQTTAPPTLKWLLDDAEAIPVALREISSVRADDMLSGESSAEDQPRAFTGVYEFAGLLPDTLHKIIVAADGIRESIETHTLPAQVPASLDGSFNVLLVSCFHRHEDPSGVAGTIVSQLKATARPHMTLLMGDQVYLDLPTLQDFKDEVPWLAKKFEDDYTTNWQVSPGYSQVLAAAPSISMPDDHEFWNNYPHPSPIVGNTLHHKGRDNWRKAALALYEGFQLPYPSSVGEPTIIEVAPLSFFLPDMRSLRDEDRRFTMNDRAHRKMKDWVTDLIARKDTIDRKLFGVVITGQSLFSEPTNELAGAVGDYELPDYEDFPRIMTQLQRLADAGLQTLCLTGDVHWGRVVKSVDVRAQRAAFYEVISSPSSLVTTVGVDQSKKIGGVLGGLFGKSNPWPRHSDAPKPPDFLASDVLAGRFRNSMLHPQKGNHVALLRFSRHGGGIELRITYWPIRFDTTIGKPQEVGPLQLTIM